MVALFTLEREIETENTNSSESDPNKDPKVDPISDLTNKSLDVGIISPKPPRKDPDNTIWDNPHSHMIFLAILYGFILFLGVCAAEATPFSVVFIFPAVLSTVVLTAAWSVLGPGNYFQRLFWSHLVGVIPALGLLAGFFVMTLNRSYMGTDDLFLGFAIGALSIAPISLGAQLPFWFFRGFFGWQFVLGNENPSMPFNLKDIFAITFVFALCFAVPQIAYNIQSAVYQRGSYVDNVRHVPVTQPDGSVEYEEELLTPIEVKQQESLFRQQMQQTAMMSYAFATGLVFVGTLFCVPVLLFTFRSRERATGCGITALYVFALSLLPLSMIVIFTGGGADLGEAVFYFLLTFALCGAGLAVPFTISREAGFILTSPKRYARENSYEEEIKAIYEKAELEPPKPIDPFAD